MVEHLDGVADLEALRGLTSSMMRSLGPVKGPPERKTKGFSALKLAIVDAVDVFERAAGGELDVDGGGDLDVREGGDDVRDFDGG